MKLVPLELYLWSKLLVFSRKYNLKETIINDTDNLDSIVVLADGTPDDLSFAIISHYLNGDKAVAIVKPNNVTGFAVLDLIPTYLTPHTKNILIIMDQEDNSLEDISQKCNTKLRQKGCHNIIDDKERLKICDCTLGNKKFKVILVLNGLDEINTKKHCIEDHLVKFSGIKCIDSSKNTWNNLSTNKKEQIYREMLQSNNLANIFHQHVKAGSILKK